jgi:hypothetical protein
MGSCSLRVFQRMREVHRKGQDKRLKFSQRSRGGDIFLIKNVSGKVLLRCAYIVNFRKTRHHVFSKAVIVVRTGYEIAWPNLELLPKSKSKKALGPSSCCPSDLEFSLDRLK